MRELWIKKVTVNTAKVVKRNTGGSLEDVTEEMPIIDAHRYLLNHQRELRCYKIAYKSNRKNAVRHLNGVYYFATDEEAIEYFNKVSMPAYNLQLLTGDWKLLAERPSEI